MKFEPYEEHDDIEDYFERFEFLAVNKVEEPQRVPEWFGRENVRGVEEPSGATEAVRVYPCTDYRTADSTFQTKAACYSRAFCLP